MSPAQMIIGSIFLALGIGAFIISYLQFKEKGYLFNNAYIWASQEERKHMDKDKERKSLITANPVLHLCLSDSFSLLMHPISLPIGYGCMSLLGCSS